VICLQAVVLACFRDSTQQEKARGIFLDVLKKDSACLDAVIGLCTLYKAQEKYDDAIKLLKQYLDKYNVDFLHTAMGDILATTEKYDEAILHYGIALKINQLCEAALHGIESIENIIHRGEPTEHEEGNIEEEFDAV